jgi:acetyltransferase
LNLHVPASTGARTPRAILQARSVAIVGASDSGPWPRTIFENLRAGFAGRVFLINPRRSEIWGEVCHPDFRALPEAIDTAVVLVRADLVVPVLEEGAAHGLKSAVVFSSGVGDGEEPESPGRAQALAALSVRSGLAVCGPNCLGTVSVRERLLLFPQENFRRLEPGGIGAVFQSGGILQFWLQIMAARGGRFSYAVSSGNEVDLTLEDYLDFLIDDAQTRVIVLFLEGIRRPDAFRRAAACALAAGKPIIVVKTGRSEKARTAALSHTGAIAGDTETFAAFCRAFGIIRCDDLDESVDVTLAFQNGRLPAGARLGIVVNSGGLKGLALDEAEVNGVPLATLSPQTTQALGPLLTPDLKVENPLDCSTAGALDPDNFARICGTVGQDPAVDILAVHGVLPSGERAKGSPDAYARIAAAVDKPVLAFSRMAYSVTEHSRAFQDRAGVPFLQGVPHAMRALAALGAYAAARRRGARPLPEPRHEAQLTSDIGAVLADYGIALPREARAPTPAEAASAAARIGFPVALKIVSPAASHKTEVGGVRLHLATPQAVMAAAEEMAANLRMAMPQARLDHFLVQEMVEGVEMILGARTDPLYGPVMVLGSGGVLVELVQDTVVELLPLDAGDARGLLARLKAAKLLAGFRGRPAADTDALADAVAALSRFYLEHRHCLDDIEINPLIVRPRGQGARAVDIRVVRSADATVTAN